MSAADIGDPAAPKPDAVDVWAGGEVGGSYSLVDEANPSTKLVEVGPGNVLGFFGKAPTGRPSVRAEASTNAEGRELANDLRAALIALGLVS